MTRVDHHSTDLAGARQHLIDNGIPDNERADMSLYVGRTVEQTMTLDALADAIEATMRRAS